MARTLSGARFADTDAPALRFEVFVDELPAWVGWWNTRHEMDALDGRTPEDRERGLGRARRRAM